MLSFPNNQRRVFLLAATAALLGAHAFPEGQPLPLLIQLPWVLSLLLCAFLQPSDGARFHVPAAMAAAAAGSVSLTLTISQFGATGLTAATLTLLPLLFLCMVPDEPLVSVSSGITALLGVAVITAQGGFTGLEALVACAIAAVVSFGSARLHRTDRVALHNAIVQQNRLEARWQTLIEISHDAILLVDVSTDQVIAANRVAVNWFGRNDPTSWRLSAMLREQEGGLEARCRQRIPWGVQGAVITAPGGETFSGDLRVYPLEDGDRLIVAVIIADATQRLRQAREQERANRLVQVGTVAAGIVHEINNPLAFMMANLYYLEDALLKPPGFSQPSVSTLQEVIKDTRKGARRIQKIARHMLNLSHREGHTCAAVDVRSSISMVVKMARAQLPEGSEINLDVEDVPPVLFNSIQLGQVILNLLLNAAQALERGEGGQIYVRARSRPPNRVAIEIRDTGPGMSQYVLNRATEPFFTTRTEGTGLGLSVCASIVREHGGLMTIDSVEGKGTVIRLELIRVMETALLEQLLLNTSDTSI